MLHYFYIALITIINLLFLQRFNDFCNALVFFFQKEMLSHSVDHFSVFCFFFSKMVIILVCNHFSVYKKIQPAAGKNKFDHFGV